MARGSDTVTGQEVCRHVLTGIYARVQASVAAPICGNVRAEHRVPDDQVTATGSAPRAKFHTNIAWRIGDELLQHTARIRASILTDVCRCGH